MEEELATRLQKAAKERDISIDEVHTRPNPIRQSEEVFITKNVGSEKVVSSFEVTHEAMADSIDIVGTQAEMAVQGLSEYLIDTIRYDYENSLVAFNIYPYEECWAQCHVCGEKVEIGSWAERYGERFVDEQRTFLKLYIAGKLRRNCRPACDRRLHRKI